MTALTKGGKKGEAKPVFEWNAEADQAFRRLRVAFTEAPILRHFDPSLPIKLETDASGFAVASILSQLFPGEEHAEWHPIAF